MDDSVYNSDDARPHSPLLPETVVTYTPRDPTPPFVHSDKSDSPPDKEGTSGRVRKHAGRYRKVPQIADTLILRNIVPDRPYLADELGQKPLRTELEDFERESGGIDGLGGISRHNKRKITPREERNQSDNAKAPSQTSDFAAKYEKRPRDDPEIIEHGRSRQTPGSWEPIARSVSRNGDTLGNPWRSRETRNADYQSPRLAPGSVNLPEMRSPPQSTAALSPVTSLPPLKDALPSHIVDDPNLRRGLTTQMPFHPHYKPPPRSLFDRYLPPSFTSSTSCSQTPSASPAGTLTVSPAPTIVASPLSPWPQLSSEMSQSQSPHEISSPFVNSPSVSYPTPPECRKRDNTDGLPPPSKHSKPNPEPVNTGGFQCDFPGCTTPPFQTQYLLK